MAVSRYTDANGVVTNTYTLQKKNNGYQSPTMPGKLVYGNARCEDQKYGKQSMDIEKSLGEAGLTDTFIIQTDSFVAVDKTTASPATPVSPLVKSRPPIRSV